MEKIGSRLIVVAGDDLPPLVEHLLPDALLSYWEDMDHLLVGQDDIDLAFGGRKSTAGSIFLLCSFPRFAKVDEDSPYLAYRLAAEWQAALAAFLSRTDVELINGIMIRRFLPHLPPPTLLLCSLGAIGWNADWSLPIERTNQSRFFVVTRGTALRILAGRDVEVPWSHEARLVGAMRQLLWTRFSFCVFEFADDDPYSVRAVHFALTAQMPREIWNTVLAQYE